MFRAITGIGGRSEKTAGYADVQSPFTGNTIPWQGIAFPITGQAVSMDVIKLYPKQYNSLPTSGHADVMNTTKIYRITCT